MLYCIQAFVKALLKYNTHTLEKSPVLLTRGFFDSQGNFLCYNGGGGVLMAKKHFYQSIMNSRNEEELKHRFANYFGIHNFDSTNYIDLYTPEIFFEFKLKENLKNPPTLAKIVAQTLYYAQRLYSGDDPRPLSP